MCDVGLLILRLGLGGLMIGHGAQKLLGWWHGHGLEGTGQMMEKLEMRPGRPWAMLAGSSELAGGGLTALGALNPLGPLAILGVMVMATVKAHADRPVWATEGGAELPVTNSIIALTLLTCGPGKLSIDALLGLKMSPVSQTVIVLAGIGALVAGMQPSATKVPAST
jgi:putative oxidoreductase